MLKPILLYVPQERKDCIMFSDAERTTLTVGLKKVKKALAEGKAKKVVIAKDCDMYLYESLNELCERAGIVPQFAETMAELGQACSIDVKASCACVC